MNKIALIAILFICGCGESIRQPQMNPLPEQDGVVVILIKSDGTAYLMPNIIYEPR